MAKSTSVIADDVSRIRAGFGGELTAAMAGSTVLVTGASGFLCSYLVETLVTIPDCRVIALDNYITGLPDRLAHLDVEIVRHDITLPIELGADWIVHGASIASPPFYRRHPFETIDANVAGTRNVLEAGRSSRGVVILSTSEIYGDPDVVPTPESYRGNVSCTGPRACYDESKRLAETLAWVAHDQWGSRVMTARPFNVFGPGQRLDDQRLMPDLFRAALQGEPITLHSDGKATRAMCYVSDAIVALLTILLRGESGPYNLGNDEAERSVEEIATTVANQAGVPIRFEASADPAYLVDNPQRRCPDLTKLRSLGFKPSVDLASGVARTLASYREELACV